MRAEELTDDDLSAVDLLLDFQSMATDDDDPRVVRQRIAKQSMEGINPFHALVASKHTRVEAKLALDRIWRATSMLIPRR
jgi:hypothetical protein